MEEKLEKLLYNGLVVTRRWLIDQGVSKHTIDNHVKSGLLRLIYKGVYHRQHTSLTWKSVFSSISYMNSGWSIGGKSALEVQGLSHYIAMGDVQEVVLTGNVKVVPQWLYQFDEFTVSFIGATRLWREGSEQRVNKYRKSIEWREMMPPLIVSSSEKAILELLSGVPEKTSFEHTEQIFQGLVNLSPKALDVLLTHCINIKVKRLFFWFADRFQYSWRNRLDSGNYDLGSGKRVIATKGKLDTVYNITVPREMYGNDK